MAIFDFSTVFGYFTKARQGTSPRKYNYYGAGSNDWAAFVLIGGAVALYIDLLTKKSEPNVNPDLSDEQSKKLQLDNMKPVNLPQ